MTHEDYSRFQIWIESMSDEEYEFWLEEDASDKQEEKALEFRPAPDSDEERELEDEQEGESEPEPPARRGGLRGFFRRVFRI